MQIFPTSASDSPSAFFSGMDYQSSGDGFLEAMQNAITAVGEGDSHSASAALEAEEPLVESPYTRHTTDGVTYSLDEVCFTKSELEELREQLLKEGAPLESLGQFDILVGQPDGATLAQVMASLVGQKAGSFSEDDAHAITGLLGKIDPSGSLAEDALALMRGGNGAGALELIRDALGKLGATDGIDVEVDELLALGRGLGLNADAMRGMAEKLGGNSSLTLNPSQFASLLKPASNFFEQQAANADKLEAALEKTLKPIISRARDRMEQEKEAASLQNRRVEQSRILIDKTVQERSRRILDDTASGDAQMSAAEHARSMREQNDARMLPDENSKGSLNVQDQLAKQASNAQTAVNGANQKAGMDGAFPAGEAGASADTSDRQPGQGKQDAWQDLLGKIETRPAMSQAQAGQTSSSFVYSMPQNAALPDPLAADMPENLPQNAQLARQAAAQVEQGLLTSMRNGATRLDLQLHPAELGAVAVTLIARDGEVTARLTSDRAETVDALNRQVDIMRVNLEQQGLKVDKIEVQLQNQTDDRGENSFQNLDQHNARQEEDARQRTLNRLRNLASIRNNNKFEDNTQLAQSVHNIAYTARYAGQAVHVVA